MAKQHIYLIPFLLAMYCFNSLTAQTIEVDIEPWANLEKLPVPKQEKIYLHFDKPYYASGERMWFRAYLLDAASLTEDTLCNTLIVELINSRDSLIYRQKINKIEGIFSGSFKLNEMLSEGTYRVRAYTNYMRNAGDAYFFIRPFFIGNNLSSEIKTSVSFTFLTDKMAMAEIKFSRKDKPLALKEIRYTVTLMGKKPRRKSAETTVDGLFRFEYNPKKLDQQKPTLTVFYEDSVNKYERSFVIPTKNEFDVQIFPEGGEVIHGTTNCIAFKAIKTDGLGIPVSGVLYDNDDKKVTEFKSKHVGMGKFCFFTEIYNRYYVVFTTADGETRRIDLPKAKKETCALGAVVKYGRILVHVKSEMNRMVNDSLILLGHMGGTVFYREFISGFTPAVVFNTKDMHPGIAHFVLLDKTGTSISERLAFVRPLQETSVSIDFSRLVHEKRRPVTCQLTARDSKGKPIQNGTFSVSVTDASAVDYDAGAENIMSRLLLTSDIKGFVEKPGLYFDPANKNAEEAIDLLLMTQGWRRFSVQKVLEGEVKEDLFKREKGFDLSGTVLMGNKGIPLKDVQVLAYAPNILYFDETTTDARGYFIFDSLRFPDKTQFTLEARRKKPTNEKIRIETNEPSFPNIDDNIFPDKAATAITDEYMLVTNEKYFNENGTRNIYARNRGLISITAPQLIETVKNEPFRYSSEEYILEGPLLKERENESLPALLQSLPGMEGWNEEMQPKTKKGDNPHEEIIKGPRFAIDNIIYSYNEIKHIPINQLEAVTVFKSPAKEPTASNTLLSLSFKVSNPILSSADKHTIASIMPLGYADNVQFYVPKYEHFSARSNPLPDWRSTLIFIPELRTDSKGQAVFSFYTADRLAPYKIEIEGISPQGEPCRMLTKKMLLSKDYLHQVE